MTAVVDPFVVDPVRPERYSMSFLRAATGCLRRAHYERIQDVAGEDALIGRIFHEIRAAVGWATVLRGHETPDFMEVERLARRALGRPEEHDPLSRHVRETVLELVGKWMVVARFHPDDQFEVSMRHELRGRIISARIDQYRVDRAERIAYVKDAKTGRAEPPPRPAPTPQGDVYAWELVQEHPWLVGVWFETEHPRFNHPPQPFFYDRDEIAKVDAWLYDAVGRIDAAYDTGGELPATPGDVCSLYDGCPVADTCPAKAWARPATVIRSHDQALAEFAELLAEERDVEDRKTAIRAWLERETLRAAVESEPDAVLQLAAVLAGEASVAQRKKKLRGWIARQGLRAVHLNGQEIGYSADAGEATDWKALALDSGAADPDAIAAHTKPKNPSFGRRKAK